MFRRIGISIFICLLMATSVYAFPDITNSFNGVFFNNSEVLIDKDNSENISVGDIFWGVLQVQQIKAPADMYGQTGPTIWSMGGGISPPAEITGYFATEVKAVYPPGSPAPPNNPISAGSGTIATIILGPVTVDPNGTLDTASGEVIRIFEDSSVNFDDSTQGSALATATNGTLLWSLGFGPSSNGASPGGYWYTLAPTVPPGSGSVGESFAGLNIITAPPNDAFALVNDPNENYSSNAGVFGGLSVQLWFNSEILRLPSNPNLTIGPNEPMHFGSNDPAVYIPEEKELGACRLTGGHVTIVLDPDYAPTYVWIPGTYANMTDKKITVTTGGQIGAPQASPSGPSFGEWEHHQHCIGTKCFSFNFKAGTASDHGTIINSVVCADKGWCGQARCAPFKQIFWDGIGKIKKIDGPFQLPPDVICNNIGEETFHYFKAHVTDMGEPGSTDINKRKPPTCPIPCPWTSGGVDVTDLVLVPVTSGDPQCADKGCQTCPCGCGDWYEIEIHCTTDPSSPIIYTFEHLIPHGNFQIHPPVGTSCN